ncbi:unnamed protein product, partial [Iphiclides podalirius]
MNTDMDPLVAEDSQGKDCIPLNSANTQVAATQSAVMPAPQPMGPSNTVTHCPHCQATVKTSIKRTATTRTHLTALLCCVLCCCCCIPYCMDSTRNTDHYCPNCDRFLGTYQK